MSSTIAFTAAPARRPALRPLVLPTEHGGWGFLFEPLILGLAVRPSIPGALVMLAFVAGFLTRQPLRLALQDAVRGRSYPRTRWCRGFALLYALAALAALACAVAMKGPALLIPIGLVAPLGLTQILYDANNRSRALLPELAGSVAMSSSAAAIAIAGGMRMLPAFALSALIVARGIPTIVYVRRLLTRAHGKTASAWPAIALHGFAIGAVWMFAPKLAVAALALLLLRAVVGLARPVPPAKKLGWTEITWGAVTVVLFVWSAVA